MILDNIMEKDLDNCKEVINGDSKLREIDAVFYDLLDRVDDSVKTKLEDAYIEYAVRAIRLAYLQGLKDFNRLCLELKEDTATIIEELDKALHE